MGGADATSLAVGGAEAVGLSRTACVAVCSGDETGGGEGFVRRDQASAPAPAMQSSTPMLTAISAWRGSTRRVPLRASVGSKPEMGGASRNEGGGVDRIRGVSDLRMRSATSLASSLANGRSAPARIRSAREAKPPILLEASLDDRGELARHVRREGHGRGRHDGRREPHHPFSVERRPSRERARTGRRRATRCRCARRRRAGDRSCSGDM